jgi:hypothetical protein
MPSQLPEPFHSGFQYEALALLLQNPSLYGEYYDCWVTKLFDDLQAGEILRHWLTIQALGSVPSRTTLEHSLRLDTPRGREAELLEPVLDLGRVCKSV